MAKRGRKPGTKKTGGRVAGTAPKKIALTEAMMIGISPLEHMLNVVRTPMPTQLDDESPESYMSRCKWHIGRQDQMASAAAPYVHPRLSSIETKKNEDQFAAEQSEKNKDMDILEIARRIAFVLAEADRMQPPTQDAPESRAH